MANETKKILLPHPQPTNEQHLREIWPKEVAPVEGRAKTLFGDMLKKHSLPGFVGAGEAVLRWPARA